MAQDQTVQDPLIGAVIDRRYKVERRLGIGGMGIVYLVEHSYLNKPFALKVMRPTKDETDRKRFEQEARLASIIRHPNVVEISDFGVLPTNQPYYVMEFLRGRTVGDAIFAGFMDSQLVCHIGIQISRGLQAIHKQNVVHRDLKPDNIFLIDPDQGTDQDGGDREEPAFVKIMDFGIAKSFNSNLTGTGMTVGTPEYMSPEQAKGETVDWRSDQYSLGCILYEMLTREIPFDGKGAFEVMYKHLHATPVAPRDRKPERRESITPHLEEIVLRMLAKKPKERHSSMREVEQLLRRELSYLQMSNSTTVMVPSIRDEDLLPDSDSSPTAEDATARLPRVKPGRSSAHLVPVHVPPETSNNRPTKIISARDRGDMMNFIDKIGGKVHSAKSLPPLDVPERFFSKVVRFFRDLFARLVRCFR